MVRLLHLQLTKAYKQNPKRVDKWPKEDYPAIANKAKTDNAEITGVMKQVLEMIVSMNEAIHPLVKRL